MGEDNNNNTPTIDKNKNPEPFTRTWRGRKRWMGNVPGRRLSRPTIRKLYLMRDLRMKRLPPRAIMHELKITPQSYYTLMYYIEREDAQLLAFENKDRLQTEIALYEETAGEIISANLEIVKDRGVEPQDRQESSRIALDAAMTVVKIHTEGPRIIREAYAPVAQYIGFKEQPFPLPQGQKHREKELVEKQKKVRESSNHATSDMIPLSEQNNQETASDDK